MRVWRVVCFFDVGLLEIAFDQNNLLRVTELGRKALRGKIEVKMAVFKTGRFV